MPQRIRLTALIANGFLCLAFGIMALLGIATEPGGIIVFFAVVAAIAGFNWYVIRKAARILAEESQRLAELQQHCAALEARASSEQGPAP